VEAEIQGYLTEFGILREQTREVLQGLGDEAANWCPLSKDTNSIYAILSHLIGAQNFWFRQVISGETIKRDRENEFSASGKLQELVSLWEKAGIEMERILSTLSLAQLDENRTTPFRSERPVNIRWCILHVLSHNATHLGHIQLTRQMWEQKSGK
jgi:uncharacterized damage-inducible protein DinB